MPRNSADNFSPKVIKNLRERVAHKCSNPDCDTPTIGPGPGEHAVANIGKAAHIAAASPGGPRYDASMNSEQRSSISNAIWLCSNCATKIDVHPDAYPTPMLQDWKRLAERAADQRKGKRPPHPDDARNELVTALTGMPKKFAYSAIQNVHGATEQALHALDPRLRVETLYSNDTTIYRIHALENTPFKISVPSVLAKQWHSAIQSFHDHGTDARLPAFGIEIKGSPLLEQLFSDFSHENAHLELRGQKKPAVMKLKLLNKTTQQLDQFDDLVGHISFGAKSFTFDGSSFGGLLKLSLSMQIERWSVEDQSFNMSTSSELWDKQNVLHLPHFEKMLRLFSLLASDWKIQIHLEIGGLSILSGTADIPSGTELIELMDGMLNYINHIRKIAVHLGATIFYEMGTTVTYADYENANEVVAILEGTRVYEKSDLKKNPTCHITAQDNGGNIRHLIDNPLENYCLKFISNTVAMSTFNQTILLPKLQIEMGGMGPKLSIDPMKIKDGDSVFVEWEPTTEFQCTYKYLEKDEEPSPST
jgi:hypothetical protein